jgi:hypothetical protein
MVRPNGNQNRYQVGDYLNTSGDETGSINNLESDAANLYERKHFLKASQLEFKSRVDIISTQKVS